MKKVFSLLLAVCLMVAATACSDRSASSGTESAASDKEETETTTPSAVLEEPQTEPDEKPIQESPSGEIQPKNEEGTKILIAYFT